MPATPNHPDLTHIWCEVSPLRRPLSARLRDLGDLRRERRNRAGLLARLRSRGPRIETGGGEDATSIRFDVLKNDLDFVFPIWLDLLRNPEFRQEKIDLAKTQILAPPWGEYFLSVNSTDWKGGIVRPQDREKVLTEATQALLNAVDQETGAHIVTRVFRPETLTGFGAGGPALPGAYG